MEPDVKTLLTQKIRVAELEPVAWNKAEVWMKVKQRVSTNPSRTRYYYAAAGVTFLLFGLLFLSQRNQDLPAEKSIVEQSATAASTVPHPVAIESKAKEKSVVNVAPFAKQAPSEITYALRVEELPEMHPAQEEEKTLAEEVVEELSVTFATPEESILPIVGVVRREEQKQAVHTKTKRKKLRTLEPIEKTGTEPGTNLILARIK